MVLGKKKNLAKFETVFESFNFFFLLYTRLALAFYCIGSLDLLGVIEEEISASDRQLWREWLWQQQARRSNPFRIRHVSLDTSCSFFFFFFFFFRREIWIRF